MKVGDKLYCHSNYFVASKNNPDKYGDTLALTINKRYEILNCDKDELSIKNDNGEIYFLMRNLKILDKREYLYSTYFYTELEYRKLKMRKLNEMNLRRNYIEK